MATNKNPADGKNYLATTCYVEIQYNSNNYVS